MNMHVSTDLVEKFFHKIFLLRLTFSFSNDIINNVRRLCFISRDGYILKLIYDYLYGSSSQITKYFYSSRIMLYQAAITNDKDWVYDRLLEVKENQVVYSCLDRIGLSINKGTLLDKYGIDLDSIITKKI